MIIEKKKIIFCHVDKTAGSMITKQLNPDIKINSILEPILHEDKHKTMKELIKKVTNEEEYFKIAFVRNPYDRVVSKYFHHKRVNAGTIYEKRAKYMEFNAWVKNGGLTHFRPQHLYVYDGDKNLCNFIGKYENLHNDYKTLQEKFSLEDIISLNENPLKNKDIHFMDYYDKDSIRFINEKYNRDFDLFDYEMITV